MKSAVRKFEIPGNKAFVLYNLNDPFFDNHWHFHSEYQLFLVLEGEGTRFIGDSIDHFEEGDMVLTAPNMPHLWRNDEVYFDKSNNVRARGIVIYFSNFLGDSFLAKDEMLEIKQLFDRAGRGLRITGETNRLVTKQMKELVALQGLESILQLLTILHVLSTAVEYEYIASLAYTTNTKEVDKDRMSGVYNYIMLNYRKNIMLEEVAEIANMSPTAFSRYFKGRTNKSFSGFISELRIGSACKLLMNDKYNIAQVSLECGFNTISNFNKQFKDLMHKTPFEYRKEYLKII